MKVIMLKAKLITNFARSVIARIKLFLRRADEFAKGVIISAIYIIFLDLHNNLRATVNMRNAI